MSIFRRFRKTAKSDYQLSHVCLTVRPDETTPLHWTDFHEIWYIRIFRKSVNKIQVSLKPGKSEGHFTWRALHMKGPSHEGHFTWRALHMKGTSHEEHFTLRELQMKGTSCEEHFTWRELHTKGTLHEGHFTWRALHMKGTLHEGHFTWRALHMNGTSHEGHFTRMELHVKETSHEGNFMWRALHVKGTSREGHFTWRPIHIFYHSVFISSWNKKCFRKCYRENQNTNFVFGNFLSKIVPFMRKCEINCRARQATDDIMARAHCLLDM